MNSNVFNRLRVLVLIPVILFTALSINLLGAGYFYRSSYVPGSGPQVKNQSKLTKPECNIKSGFYLRDKKVTLVSKEKKAKIYFTLDGSEPSEKSNLYDSAFVLNKTAVLKAITMLNKKKSNVLIVEFTRIENIKSIVLKNQPSDKYPVDNIYCLFDKKNGSGSYDDGKWFGFEGADFEAVITFENAVPISRVNINCMQETNSWIFFPKLLEYYVSPDGNNFIKAGIVDEASLKCKEDTEIRSFEIPTRTAVVKAIKIVAKNIGVCPDGHPGAGGKAWIFIDEISFK
jgi:hexosaminidase